MVDDKCKLTVGCIARIKNIANVQENQESFTVKVLNIYRYIVDKHFPSVDNGSSDAFDIVITDGRYMTTCLLSNTFNYLVYGRNLQENSVISVTKCTCYVDEESLDGLSYVMVRGLEILGFPSAHSAADSCIEEIGFCEHATLREKQKLPLAANRGYYLPLWNDEDFFGEIWCSDPDLVLRNKIKKAISISDLATFWKTFCRPFPALIGRIVGKSRLNHYGKATDVKKKYPYQAYLELEDRSATVSICLWNSSCVELFNYLQVGDIIAVLKYRVGRKFAQRSNAVYNTSNAVNIEISVNPSNPVGEIYKVASEDIGPILAIPEVPYRFIERRALANFCSGLICDVIGVVIFVSQEIRERKANGTSLWLSKWVHLQDGTSPYPIILHVFASSQPDVFTGIVPGKVLVCSRVLLRIEPHDSKHRKFCFATTTRESQTYLLKQPSDINSKPFRGCGIVNDVINWRQSVKAKQFLGRSCSGGFYSFPPVPDSLDSYKRTFPADSPIELTSTVNLGLLVEHLHFRQHLRVHVQGVVAAIELIPLDVDAARGLSQTFEQTSCSQEYSLTHGGAESGEASRTKRGANCSRKESINHEQDQLSGQSRHSATKQQSVRRKRSYARRVNPPRSCKTARRRSSKELSRYKSAGSSTDGSAKHTTSTWKKFAFVSRRVNPRRKCRKDVWKKPQKMKGNSLSGKMSSDVHKANRPNNAQKRAKTGRNEEMSAGSPSENAMDSASKAVGQKILENAQQPGQPQRNDNTLVREWNNAKPIEKTGSYFPFRILDPTWVKSAADMPTWGMPHAHRDTLPRLCNRKSLGVEVFPRADRQGFVDAEGYWRLLIVGLNRQAAVNAMFMPQSSDGESPEHGVFLSALATGRLSSAHPTEMLLNCASEELKDRRTVFVLDVYCHGQGEVEVVINRAY